MPQIAFLGAGNMAAAMVQGLLAQGGARAAELACLSGSGRTAAALARKTGIRLARDLTDLANGADAVVIAFKPQHLAAGHPDWEALTAGRLVISVLAGKPLARLQAAFPRARNLVRAMPNTPSQIGAGITGWCAYSPLAAPDQAILATLLGAMGASVEVPETQMDALTAVSGSGPAYVFEFTAALREAGVAAGLAPAVAEQLASATVLGAARLLAQSGVAPERLRDQVTSPHGTTFAGLQRMAARDFRGLIRETVLAAQARAEELSRDS